MINSKHMSGPSLSPVPNTNIIPYTSNSYTLKNKLLEGENQKKTEVNIYQVWVWRTF